ncbi:MAG: hypothetical protein AABX60_00675 [Nanoarchaeota archaeon]
MNNDKFAEDCLRERQTMQKPGASPITTQLERENKSKHSLSNSHYFLEGAKQILSGSTPYLAFPLGFFAMEHAANALIALKGYSITDHKCAQIFFSKLLNREDLAKALSRAYNARIAFNYRNNLNDYRDKTEAEEFLQNEVIPFIEEIKKLLKGA